MKKLILIIAMITAVVASAQNVTYASNPKAVKPKVKECLVFDLDLMMLQGTEVVDELGSKHIHLDFVPRHATKVFFWSKDGRWNRFWEARLANGRSLSGSSSVKEAIVVMNNFEGSTDGYISMMMQMSAIDKTTPQVNLYITGQTENEWLEDESRYVLKSGSGVVSGQSYPTFFTAWKDLVPAIPSTESSMAPAWGRFTVRRAILTDAEIIEMLK